MEADITAYLIKVFAENLSKKQSKDATSLFHTLTDIERVADHAENIAELADTMRDLDLPYFDSAVPELKKMCDVTVSCYKNAIEAMKTKNKKLARQAIDEEAAVDDLEKEYRSAHINVISAGEYSLRSGVIFLDLLNNLERVADHSKNIAEAVLGSN
jgi:phosphate:Na+ symporter